MFMSLFVIYGFDTASTLAEETKNPRREAPRAVLGSIVGAFVIGGVFIWATLMAIPGDLSKAVADGLGPAAIIDANFSNAFATVYLLVVAAAIYVCCLAIQTSTIRLMFGMACDDVLPGSKVLSRVFAGQHMPIGSCIAVGVLSFTPMLQYAGAGIIAIAATGMIYLSYFIGGLAVLRARLRGWPRTKAPFSLGRWGKLVNIVAILWGLAMLLNFLTPSSASSAFDPNASGANYMRIISNPKPVQTDYYVEGEQLVDFKIDFLNKIPVIWTVFSLILIGGAIYYLAAQRRKPWESVVPTGEDLSGIVSIE